MAEILLVDDDQMLREIFAAVLEERGHTTRSAANGAEALLLIETWTPDVALVDVEMPLLDGPGMAERMLLHDLGQEDIPIVLVSAVPNLVAVAARVGTHYFLAKPCTVAALFDIVDRALTERIAPRPAERPSA